MTYYQAALPRQAGAVFDISKLSELPKVGIVYNYANASDAPVKALREEGNAGIVSAGVGNGNMYKGVFDALAAAAKEGVVVVRASRCQRAIQHVTRKWMMMHTVLWLPAD